MPISELAGIVTMMAGKMVSKRRVFAEEGNARKTAEKELAVKRASKSEDDLEAMESTIRRASNSSHSLNGSETSSVTRLLPDHSSEPDEWADPREPLSWEDGKLLSRDQARVVTAASLLSLQTVDDHQTAVDPEKAELLLKSFVPQNGRPANFGIVVPGVYRCSFPQEEDYTFIRSLGLKSVVTLVQKEFPAGYESFLDSSGIKHHVFDVPGTKKSAIPIDTMRAILHLILDRQNHPLLIHCNHGKHRTGCVVGVVRKVTGWELSSILDEYRSFAKPKERDCDIDYITAFDLTAISNLFAHRSQVSMRTRTFFRATVFSAVVLFIWLASEYGLGTMPASIEAAGP